MRYTTLDIIKAHIPNAIYEHIDDESIIEFYAFNALRQIVNDPSLYEYGVCISEIQNNVASLPDNFVEIVEGFYSPYPYFSKSSDSESNTILSKKVELGKGYYYDDGKKVYIGDAYMYVLPDAIDSICPLRYIPFGNDYIDNNCADILCKYNCVVDYYIDKTGNFIRVSEEDGYVCLLYKRYIQDEQCNVYIPDDVDLINAITYTVIAKIFEERSYRKEQSTYDLSRDAYEKARIHHTKYARKRFIKRFNSDNYNRYIVNRLLGPALVYNKMRFNR